jgi:hypothetical protein
MPQYSKAVGGKWRRYTKRAQNHWGGAAMTTNRQTFSFTRLGITCLFILALASNRFSYAELLFELPRVLEVLVKPLDKAGVDVFIGQLPPSDTHNVPKRARVGFLNNIGERAVASAGTPERWSQSETGRQYEAGGTGFLETDLNIKPHSLIEQTFSFSWMEAAPKRARVFLAFARADARLADKVREVLESNGYVTFIYRRDPDKTPEFSADYTAEMFYEADYHLVLYTENSRASDGLQVEALSLEIMRGHVAWRAAGNMDVKDDFIDRMKKRARPNPGQRRARYGADSASQIELDLGDAMRRAIRQKGREIIDDAFEVRPLAK